MERQLRPLPKAGSNLTSRLYLLLAVIFLPAFLTYYVYSKRTLEAQRAQEIDARARLIAGAVENWLAASRPAAIESESRPELERLLSLTELNRMIRLEMERVDSRSVLDKKFGREGPIASVKSVNVFCVGKRGEVRNLGATGGDAEAAATPEDLRALKTGEVQSVLKRIDEEHYNGVSFPLRYRDRTAAILHIVSVPRPASEELPNTLPPGLLEDAGTRLSEAFLGELGEDLRAELDLKLNEHPGLRSLRVSYQDRNGQLRTLAASPASAPGNSVLDSKVAPNRSVTQRVPVERGQEILQAVWMPAIRQNEVLGGVQIELAPQKFGVDASRLRTQLLIGAAAVMLLGALGVAVFMHRSVRRPIQHLIDAMDRAAGGDLAALVEVGSGELGWVAGSFNQMLWRLKASMDENRRHLDHISRFNQELKRQIDQATNELATKNAQLEAMNEKLFILQRQMTTIEKLAALGQISATIAHELGTPLNAISGHVQLLLQDHIDDPKARERLTVIDGQLDRLTTIIRNVLKTMRMPPPQFERVSVNHVVEDMVDLIAPVVQKRKIQVETKLSRDLPLISADAYQLEQVFMNLFTNAMDAMPGGGTLSVATSFVSAEEAARLAQESSLTLGAGGHLRIDIRDTGQGMDEETSRRLFEPFFTTKGVDTGTGLGLSICRQIVKNHDGAISVQTAPGKGTTFSILLPVERERVVVG